MDKIVDLKNVPKLPGIYIWKDINNIIMYIGKAHNLNSRMNQYFLKHNKNSFMFDTLVSRISSFEYIITKDEKDALILESNLIKKHKPKYNIMLIDDKSHRFIRVELVKNNILITLSRRYIKDKATYFGPFPSRHKTRNILNLLNRISKFENGLPVYSKDPIFWEKKYKLCLEVLNPNNSKLKKAIKNKMEIAAENQNYELAEEHKSILNSLDFYLPKTIVELTKNLNQDIWGIYKENSYYSIYIMFYRSGKLLSTYQTMIKDNLLDKLKNYIRFFYEKNILPDEVFISSEFLTINDLDINIINPKKSNGLKILNMAIDNAKDNFENKLMSYKKAKGEGLIAINKLADLLKIKIPYYLIMIDNSMWNNIDPVSALVVYRDGVMQKNEYRKYNLVLNERKADVDYMKQTFVRFIKKNINKLPDLIVLDGGIPQVSEINKVILDNNLKVNIIGLVKDNHHQTRAIINNDLKEIKIEDKDLMIFLASMQIEVDRFAKNHYRSKRRIKTLEGSLLKIKGIGLKTEERLLSQFKTYANIYNTPLKELEKFTTKEIASEIKKSLSKH